MGKDDKKKETHIFVGNGVDKRIYKKEGPSSSGRKGKTIWTKWLK